MERRQSGSIYRVRTANRTLLFPVAGLPGRRSGGLNYVRGFDSAAAEPLPAGEWGSDAGAGARKSDFRASPAEGRSRDSRAEPLFVLSFGEVLHQPTIDGRREREADGPVAADRSAPFDQRCV